MTCVYLWDAPAAGKLGVADSRPLAAAAAAACLAGGGKAHIEAAWIAPGEIVNPGYRRSGICWTGELTGGQVVWSKDGESAA